MRDHRDTSAQRAVRRTRRRAKYRSVPPAAAIANAIARAIGVRVLHMPMTPSACWRPCRAAKADIALNGISASGTLTVSRCLAHAEPASSVQRSEVARLQQSWRSDSCDCRARRGNQRGSSCSTATATQRRTAWLGASSTSPCRCRATSPLTRRVMSPRSPISATGRAHRRCARSFPA